MNNVTLKEACEIARKKMRDDSNYLNQYSFIKMMLMELFDQDNIDDEFYELKKEAEIIEFVKEIIGDVKIEKIEIVPNKTVLVRGNGHYDLDESFSKRNHEIYIVKMIRAFSGYAADVSL